MAKLFFFQPQCLLSSHIALAVAPTRLAAESLEGGRKSHSLSNVTIPICDTSVYHIPILNSLANLIRCTKIVIWDEVMASNQLIVECVDINMQGGVCVYVCVCAWVCICMHACMYVYFLFYQTYIHNQDNYNNNNYYFSKTVGQIDNILE